MGTETKTAAIRVLKAMNIREEPEPADVSLLRSHCPDHRQLDTYELACIVIMEGLPPGRETRESRQSRIA